MKTLMILRHAKASRDVPISDFERVLKGRGERDADALGRLLRKRQLLPDFILCSSAVRARRTAERLIAESGRQIPLELTGELYLAPWSDYVGLLRSLSDEHARVMVVGHNPSLEEWQTAISGRWEKLSPGTLAILRLPIAGWNAISIQTRGDLEELVEPASKGE